VEVWAWFFKFWAWFTDRNLPRGPARSAGAYSSKAGLARFIHSDFNRLYYKTGSHGSRLTRIYSDLFMLSLDFGGGFFSFGSCAGWRLSSKPASEVFRTMSTHPVPNAADSFV
jgi:hypothetical protein